MAISLLGSGTRRAGRGAHGNAEAMIEVVATEVAARRGRTVARLLAPVVVLVAGLALWSGIVSAFHVPAYLMPEPWTLARTAVDEAGQFVTPVLVTMREAYLGFLLSAVLGVAVAMAMARWTVLEVGVYPYLLLLQTLPIIAVAPLLVVWLGAGTATNTTVATVISFFPVVTNTLTGLKATEANLVDLYRMAGAGRLDELLTLRLPYAMPYLFAGLRIAAGASVIGAIVGEFVAGEGGGAGGLGYVITEDAIQLRTPELFVGVALSCAVAVVLFGGVSFVGNRLLRRWHDSARRRGE